MGVHWRTDKVNGVTFEGIDNFIVLSENPCNKYLEYLQEWFGTKELYYRFLYYLILYTRPKVCLEIGIENGVASAHMCAAAKHYEGRIIGVDIRKPPFDLTSPYGNYNFIHLDSANAGSWVKAITDNYGKIGVVFQDSSHHYKRSCVEWNIYSEFLDKNAVWVCDDITEDFYRSGLDEKSMVGYFEERPGKKRVYDNLHKGSKVGVILL